MRAGVGLFWEGYKSTLGRTPLKNLVHKVPPIPAVDAIYPKGKFKHAPTDRPEFSHLGLETVARCYGSLDADLRPKFDNSLFAFYTAKDLLQRRFRTIAAVALIAALKPFRGVLECEGCVSCSKCGNLPFQHNIEGEASALAKGLAGVFELRPEDEKRNHLQACVKAVYGTQRSSFVHDAVFRHGEFEGPNREVFPCKQTAISEKLVSSNQLSTLNLLTRRALLQYLHGLTGQRFEPSIYTIDPAKFESRLGATGFYVVSSKYWTAIRAMGSM
jgi:hypothetical protein